MSIDVRYGKAGRRSYRARVRRRGFPPMTATFDTREAAEAWSRATKESMSRLAADERIAASLRRRRPVRTPGQRIGDAEPYVLSLEEAHRRRQPLPSPELVGVYVLFHGDTVVYVGRTTYGLSRVFAHCRDKVFDAYTFIPVPERVLDDVEALCIHVYKPTLNIKKGSMIATGLKGNEALGMAPWTLDESALRQQLTERRAKG